MKVINKKGFRIAVLFAVTVIMMILCPPVFYLNDDVAMRSILSGAYTGTPNGHAVYMQYPLTGVLAVLYRVLGFVPWMEVLLTGSVFACMLFLAESFENRVQGILLAIAVYIPFILHMHYTLVAALLAATAIFLLVKGEKGICSGILLLLAFLIRGQVGLLSLPFVLCALIFRVLYTSGQERKKECLGQAKWCGIVLGAMLLCSIIHGICYSSPEWKEYNSYNDSRTLLYDYTDFLSTDFYEENCASYGMTPAEYEVLHSYNNILEPSVDAEKMQDIADKVAARMEQNSLSISKVKESIYQYYLHIRYNDRPYSLVWIVAVILVAIVCIWSKNWLQLGVLGVLEIGRSLIWVYLLWKGRFPERVSITLYLLELLLLMGMLQRIVPKVKWSVAKKTAAGWGLVALLLIACAFQWKDTFQEVKSRHEVQEEWEELKAYCGERPGTIYWMDVFSVVQYAEKQYTKDTKNMKLLGGWLSASPLTAEVLEQIGVADAAESLYDSRRVRLLVRKDKDMQWLEDYLKSEFGACELVIDGEILLQSGECFLEYEVRAVEQ